MIMIQLGGEAKSQEGESLSHSHSWRGYDDSDGRQVALPCLGSAAVDQEMAAPLNSLPGVALPPYLLVNVAHVSLPDVATQGRQLFVDIEPPPSTIGSDHSSSDARSSQQEGSSSGFAFDRALGGIKATQQQQQQGTASDGKAGTVASVTQR